MTFTRDALGREVNAKSMTIRTFHITEFQLKELKKYVDEGLFSSISEAIRFAVVKLIMDLRKPVSDTQLLNYMLQVDEKGLQNVIEQVVDNDV